jgi:dGTP triphosphohydrolase
MLQTLLEVFAECLDKPSEWRLFPVRYQEQIQELARVPTISSKEESSRLIIDMIASMTELEVIDTHSRITGIKPGTLLEYRGF